MRRLFWLAMGAAFGVLLFRKLSRAAERLTPQGMVGSLTQALADLGDTVREFAAEVRDAMGEREAELRTGTGLDGNLGKAE